MQTKRNIFVTIALLLGILVLINVLAERYFFRIDLTANNRYTLSEATINVVQNLDQPITITCYFSDNLPNDVAQTKRHFKELLLEYASYSNDMITYNFKDPPKDKKEQRKLLQQGIRPVIVNVREQNQMKQQRVFLGAKVQQGDQTEVIPFVKPDDPIEYKLSTSIKKLSVDQKPIVGFVQGHGEMSLRKLQQVRQSLSVLNKVEPVQLSDTTRLYPKYQTLAIVAPKDSFPRSHRQKLERYLSRGGRLYIAYNRVKGNMKRATGQSVSTGLENWLAQKGIVIENKFVTDANCNRVMVSQQRGFNQVVQFPYLPNITNFASQHPITTGLEQVTMQFASPIKVKNIDTSRIHYTLLAQTSSRTGTESPPLRFNISRQWGQDDFPLSHLPVAIALEGKLAQGASTKMVVVSDGDFAQSQQQGRGRRRQQQQLSDNMSFMVNAIEWLNDKTGLLTLRTQGLSSHPIKQLENSTQTIIKYSNFIFPILVAIAIGIIRRQRNRQRRAKWRAQKYA